MLGGGEGGSALPAIRPLLVSLQSGHKITSVLEVKLLVLSPPCGGATNQVGGSESMICSQVTMGILRLRIDEMANG